MSRRAQPYIVVLLAVAAMAADKPTPRQALALAQQYLSHWEETLVALVAEERYDQEMRVYRLYGGRSGGGWMPEKKRRLASEVLLLRAPADDSWLSFRDVMSVDGARVHDRERRLDALFSGVAAEILTTAHRIADEGARYNLGRLHRTINTPTAPLAFLKERYARSTDWTLDATAELDRQQVWILRFNQQRPPFVVTIQGGVPYPAAGSFWLEPRTGRIKQAELVVKAGAMKSTVRIRYGPVPAIDEWVPLRMEDGYRSERDETIKGVAIYSKHRLFRTSVRIVGPQSR